MTPEERQKFNSNGENVVAIGEDLLLHRKSLLNPKPGAGQA